MTNNIIIVGKKLLIEIIKNDTSAIISISNSPIIRGRIIQVGNGYSADNERYDMKDFSINDIIFFDRQHTTQFSYENKNYLLVDTSNILAMEKKTI